MKIEPKLGFFDLTMIVISLVIGIGIFRTPQIVAARTGSIDLFFAAWILGGIVSLCGALTFAEIGSRYPVAGGFYRIFSYCYHPAFAFMLNWVLVIINASSTAGVAIIGAEYINPFFFPESVEKTVAVKVTVSIIVTILFALNYAGIKTGARTQNFLSLLKIAMIVLFCAAAFLSPISSVSSDSPVAGGNWLLGFGAGLISVFFTYGGYQQTINFGADIHKPQKNVPRAIFAAMAVIVTLYLTINFAYVRTLAFERVSNSPLIAAELAGALFGETGSRLVSIAIFISVLGFVNVSMLSNPRVYYAMAQDKVLPQQFQKVNEKTQVQEFALLFFSGVILIMLFVLGTFERIVNYVMFIDTISLASAAACIFILRKRQRDTGYEGYRMGLFPLAPVIFICMILAVTINVLLDDPVASFFGFLIFVAGYPLYLLLRKLHTRSRH